MAGSNKQYVEMEAREPGAWLTSAFDQKPQFSVGNDSLEVFRQRHFTQFLKRGFPSRREELWKYTDLSFLEKTNFYWPSVQNEGLALPGPLKELISARAQESILLVFINGHFVPQLSALSQVPEGVILGSLRHSLEKHADLINDYLLREVDTQRYPLASLNAALFTDGLFLYLPPSLSLEKPLHLLSLSSGGKNLMSQLRHLLILEQDTQLSFIEEYLDEAAEHYLTNVCSNIFAGRNARLNYYKIQNEADTAKHFATQFIHQKQNSFVNACSFAVGGQISRTELILSLQEQEAACHIKGFYGLDADRQLIDHYLYIDHAAPHTQSEMDFRGVLARQSRAVFHGKVLVRPEAKKTRAQQINHNLLLSPLAEIDTKPELEIYADEVQCRHGATAGQLNEEALFYLRTRGFDRRTAIAILLRAFIEQALSEVSLPWVVEYMQEQWGRRLERILC